MSVQEQMLNDVEKDHDLVDVALYLSNKSDHEYDLFELLKIAKFLLYENQIPKENILNASVDKTIVQYLHFYLMRKNSVKKEDENVVEIELNAKKKHIDSKMIKRIFLMLLGLGVVAGSIFTFIKTQGDKAQNLEVTQYIGAYASNNPEFKGSIVGKNTYHVPNTTDTFAYYNDQIASDIVKVCAKDPNLFSATILNTYESMKYNRLTNMDEVVSHIKDLTKSDISLLWMYAELENCQTFLDFVIKQVPMDINSEEYKMVKQDVEKYYVGRQKNPSVVFEELPSDSQKRIKKLLEKYTSNKSDIYDEALDSLKELSGNMKRG